MTNFGYRVPGDEDPTDTPENNVSMIQTGPPPFDDPGEPITPPEEIDPSSVPGDDVPEYPNEDEDGDRAAALTDPEHTNIEDIPDNELGAEEATPDDG